MKILLINNFYYNRGGDCTYLFSLKRLLEEKGHQVIVFSMHHPQNFESEYSEYFVTYINYVEEVKNKNLFSGLKVISRTIYSFEARKNLERLIKDKRPDIAHLQNIHHHITPSIFYPLKKFKIPIIWTLHDYTLICPNTSFLSQGKICERCKKIRYFWPSVVRCKKGSFAASTMAAIESTMHRIMRVYDVVDFFITPSKFLRNKLIEYGFDSKKIVCLNNFLDVTIPDSAEPVGDYFLYIGRLSEEKGIKTLIDAVIKAGTGRLKIVGDGQLKDELISYVRSNSVNGAVEFLGYKKHEEVIKLLRRCRFVVLPSDWYENFPYSILEAFACGRPVIGSRIGGIPELIDDGENGLLFTPGDSDALADKIKKLHIEGDKISEMSRNAQKKFKENYGHEKHYQRLMEIYKQAMG